MPAALAYFLFFAVVCWIAALRHWRRVEYVAKPATLAALIAYAALAPDTPRLLLVALAASLAGDVFLMLPFDAFAAGLGAFLVAHLAYIATFDAAWTTRAVWFGALVACTAPANLRVLRAIPPGALRPAATAYTLVLLLMTASAIASGPRIAAVGALLFLLSDTLLAWDRFVRPWSWAHAAVLVTYHLGQLGLTLGLLAR
ncbi:MAG: lysoplasmalogenase family protein [Candidatus Binatia bacterium]